MLCQKINLSITPIFSLSLKTIQMLNICQEKQCAATFFYTSLNKSLLYGRKKIEVTTTMGGHSHCYCGTSQTSKDKSHKKAINRVLSIGFTLKCMIHSKAKIENLVSCRV